MNEWPRGGGALRLAGASARPVIFRLAVVSSGGVSPLQLGIGRNLFGEQMFASHTPPFEDLLHQLSRDTGFFVAILLLGLAGVGIGAAVWTASPCLV